MFLLIIYSALHPSAYRNQKYTDKDYTRHGGKHGRENSPSKRPPQRKLLREFVPYCQTNHNSQPELTADDVAAAMTAYVGTMVMMDEGTSALFHQLSKEMLSPSSDRENSMITSSEESYEEYSKYTTN